MIAIDTLNFTPFAAFSGGLLIGFAVILFFVTTGRLAGVSGIVNSALTNTKNWQSNFLFLIGLLEGSWWALEPKLAVAALADMGFVELAGFHFAQFLQH